MDSGLSDYLLYPRSGGLGKALSFGGVVIIIVILVIVVGIFIVVILVIVGTVFNSNNLQS